MLDQIAGQAHPALAANLGGELLRAPPSVHAQYAVEGSDQRLDRQPERVGHAADAKRLDTVGVEELVVAVRLDEQEPPVGPSAAAPGRPLAVACLPGA